MVDRLGLIPSSPIQPQQGPRAIAPAADPAPGNTPSFKDYLIENLNKVNQLQQDASTAIEDLHTGRRNDLETVIMATQKADTAFRMLLAVRNKMMDAYEEIKQIRV
jgi:flagellar hook-basal body complex protein FliE